MHGVTLDTIGGGALPELFTREMTRVLENIADPNTEASAKRTITVQISFKAKNDREMADVDIICSSKLAPIAKVSTTLYMGRQGGRLVAVENDPRQSNLFDQLGPQLAAVTSMKGGEHNER